MLGDILFYTRDELMLYFLVPLRAKATSKNWDIEMECFKNMIESVFSQVDDSFHFVLVCHNTPKIMNTYLSKASVIEVNIPIPQTLADQAIDKKEKLRIGLDYIMSEMDEDTYVMPLDSDDIVCNKLSEYVKMNTGHTGWYLEKGYRLYYNTKKILPLQPVLGINHFYKVCGSSAILKLNQSTRQIFLKYRHREVKKRCKESGIPITKLPFRGAVYVYDTGNNRSIQLKESQIRVKYLFLVFRRGIYKYAMCFLSKFIKVDYENFPILLKLLER